MKKQRKHHTPEENVEAAFVGQGAYLGALR
jgi:hypothetical protein